MERILDCFRHNFPRRTRRQDAVDVSFAGCKIQKFLERIPRRNGSICSGNSARGACSRDPGQVCPYDSGEIFLRDSPCCAGDIDTLEEVLIDCACPVENFLEIGGKS